MMKTYKKKIKKVFKEGEIMMVWNVEVEEEELKTIPFSNVCTICLHQRNII